ncbi:MAG: aminoglycoside phosphotransferase family protein [Bacilli bacterium]
MTLVPADFVERVRELYGQQGDEWLQSLPELLDRCVSRFGVSLEAPFPNLSWNLILKATKHDGTPVVLKIGVLKADLYRELSVLHAYAGRGGIQVIDADDNLGALVLERAEPGTPLSTIEDDKLATEIFCNVFQRLHCPPSTGQYASIKDHFSGIERYRHRFGAGDVIGPLPAHWVERAREYLAYLISSTNENVLLHGDLHHDNILRQKGDEWTVIDPKGIVGDRHFDTIQYLLNYEGRGGDPYAVLDRRITIISAGLRLDPFRIAMWGVARGVLEACWTIEDGGSDWNKGIQITERFAKYLD